jgi:hypothetical protein
MPWQCPACDVPIRHSELEQSPRVGARYRCHLCRLELILDPVTDKLTATPLSGVEPSAKERRTA